MAEVKTKKTISLKTPKTIQEFAEKFGITADKLIDQLVKAYEGEDEKPSGLKPTDEITPKQKEKLLAFLQGKPKTGKITLKRKKVQETRVTTQGKATTVRVERRQKRIYIPKEKTPVVEPLDEPLPAFSEALEQPTPEAQPDIAEPKTNKANIKPAVELATDKRKDTKKKTKKESESSDTTHRKSRRPRVEQKFSTSAMDRENMRIKKRKKSSEHGFQKPQAPVVHEVNIPASLTCAELANRMAIKVSELIKALMKMGVRATINQVLDQDTAVLIVEELGHKPKVINENELEDNLIATRKEQSGDTKPRAPVVTIMGHVDHGKTSLLDYIRRTRVAAKEAGGITQHIGAYRISLDRGDITFLDTPGHAAFSAMRARGANCTDISVLVVAADDGVMPQTLESVTHAQAAKTPIVVCINKIDKPEADVEKIKAELGKHNVVCEEWGGDVVFVPASAKSGEGIDHLLDAILLQAEMLELSAIADCPASGVVIESSVDKGRGAVATILVQQGTLKKGDIVIAGKEYGRVRAMLDESGKQLTSAGPSYAVEILGLSGAPSAGDEVFTVESERKAREVSEFRVEKVRREKQVKQQKAKSDVLFSRLGQGTEIKTLTVLIKADVQGSLEALSKALFDLSTDEVKIEIIASGVGGINESDVNLAISSKAEIIGFNVRADNKAKKISQEEGVKIHYYSIIYELIDNVKNLLSGLLAPEIQEKILGVAQVRDVFSASKWGKIAGCRVVEGVIKRNKPIRVLRDNVVIFEGQLESLRRFKEDVQEVRLDTECGIGVKDYNDIKPGDQIEVFDKIEVKRTL